jgi:hypothetical protein
MAAFHLQSGKQGQVGVVEDSHVVFCENSLLKEEMRDGVVVMQQPVLLSPKFGAKSSHIFTQ